MTDVFPPADGAGEPFDAEGLDSQVAGLDREVAAWLSATDGQSGIPADVDEPEVDAAPEAAGEPEVDAEVDAEPEVEADPDADVAVVADVTAAALPGVDWADADGRPRPVAGDIDAEVAGDLAELALIERDLGYVDAAMRRLDVGTYGTCTSCAATIDAEVLADGARCVSCAPVVGSRPGRSPLIGHDVCHGDLRALGTSGQLGASLV